MDGKVSTGNSCTLLKKLQFQVVSTHQYDGGSIGMNTHTLVEIRMYTGPKLGVYTFQIGSYTSSNILNISVQIGVHLYQFTTNILNF